ncbi:hypothetical protein BHE74_00037115, partial [Ensete ventricosum]
MWVPNPSTTSQVATSLSKLSGVTERTAGRRISMSCRRVTRILRLLSGANMPFQSDRVGLLRLHVVNGDE